MSNEHPTPEAIMQLTRAYAGSKALVSAAQLGLLTTLADGPLTGEVLRAKLGLQPRGTTDWLAGPTDEGVRIIDVWDSEQAWQQYRAERLEPAIAALGGPSRPEPTFRDQHPEHLLLRQTKEEK